MHRNGIRSIMGAAAALALVPWAGAGALAADSLGDALTGGKVLFNLRYRYEFVDQAGFSRDARASTARLRLGYETGLYHGLSALAELENVTAVGAEKYDSTANGLTSYPIVLDPEDSELNQAYLSYAGVPHTTFRFGRQRITLDNLRFIGNVGWRQNEQTYDAHSARFTPVEAFSLFYAHMNNVNTVSGEHHPDPSKADRNVFADLLNVSYRFPIGTLTGYAYLLEFEDEPAISHRNLGVRFSGSHEFSDAVRLLYTAEYADQSDYKDAPATVDAGYLFAQAGVGLKWFTVKAGYEVLEGDGVYAFQTPLATLHAHNGWTDKFLVTPADGLEDATLSLEASLAGMRLVAVLHDFGADAGGADYGSEIDLLISRTFQKKYTAALKYATYDADTFATDTDKLWVTLELRF